MDEPSPRFRQNLVASAIEAEGVPCVDVSDPQTGNSFRFYDFEYQLALQLNGQPIREVTAWASATYGVDLTPDGIGEFAGRLAELGFLEPPASSPDNGTTGTTGTTGTREAAVATPGAAVAAPAEAQESAESEWMNVESAKTATFVPDVSMLDQSTDLTPVVPELPSLATPEPLARAERDEAGPPETAASPGESDETPVPEPTPVPQRSITPPPPVAPPAATAAPRPPVDKEPVRSVAVTRPAEAPTIPSLPSNIAAGGSRAPVAATAPAPPVPAPSPLQPPGMTPPPLGAPPSLPHRAPPASPGWASALDGNLGLGEPRLPSAPPPAAGDGRRPSGAFPQVSPPPPGLPERRQPPAPEIVDMSDFDEPAGAAVAAQGGRSSSRVIALILVAVLAAAVIGFLVWRSQAPPTPQAVRVRVLSPKPTAVYRWFSRPGKVVERETQAAGFGQNGRVAEILPAGTELAAGDIVARLQGAAALETLLTHHRSRLAYYAQMRESMRAAGNLPELRQADIKHADKQRLVDETLTALAPLVVRATEPGEVVEALGKVGSFVRAGTPVVRMEGRLLHGELDLEPEELAAARELDFCRVEVVGLGPQASKIAARRDTTAMADVDALDAQNGPRFLDCQLPAVRPKVPGSLRVALPADRGLVPGQPVRLARHRYDAVFPIPAPALTVAGDRKAVWVATTAGLAEERQVTVVELGDEALVSDGIALHEEVILDPPPGLQAGMRLAVER